MAAVHSHDDSWTLYTGDALTTLSTLPEQSVDCVVTSPPYWGLRDYGTARWDGGQDQCRHRPTTEHAPTSRPLENDSGSMAASQHGRQQHCRDCRARRIDQQCGIEATPGDYVDNLRAVFREVSRVLADTGTVWLNIGDCYSAASPGRTRDPFSTSTLAGTTAAGGMRDSVERNGACRSRSLPRGNLYGLPWRVAPALQQDGWILRSAIVWHKPNAMPQSVTTRVSNRYEYIFLLVKQSNYHFDLDAIREPATQRPDRATHRQPSSPGGKYSDDAAFAGKPHGAAMRPGTAHISSHPRGKNPGDVWSISTRPLKQAHFAAFPIDIPLRCIAAGCPDNGVVLDPFSGAGTTGLAAHQLDRSYIGIDLNPAFHDIALERRTPTHRDTAA